MEESSFPSSWYALASYISWYLSVRDFPHISLGYRPNLSAVIDSFRERVGVPGLPVHCWLQSLERERSQDHSTIDVFQCKEWKLGTGLARIDWWRNGCDEVPSRLRVHNSGRRRQGYEQEARERRVSVSVGLSKDTPSREGWSTWVTARAAVCYCLVITSRLVRFNVLHRFQVPFIPVTFWLNNQWWKIWRQWETCLSLTCIIMTIGRWSWS